MSNITQNMSQTIWCKNTILVCPSTYTDIIANYKITQKKNTMLDSRNKIQLKKNIYP
jgi:hypothetical protein